MKRINGKVIGDPIATPMPVPDYNQNDPKKADYIKNRPFYETEIAVYDKRLEGFLMDVEGGEPEYMIYDNGNLPYSVYKAGENLLFELSVNGKTYSETHPIVSVNEYGIPLVDYFDIEGVYIDIGGAGIDEDGNDVAGVQCVTPSATSPDDEYRLKIIRTIVVPLDEKFLPKKYATKQELDAVSQVASEASETATSASTDVSDMAWMVEAAYGNADDAYTLGMGSHQRIDELIDGTSPFFRILMFDEEYNPWHITIDLDGKLKIEKGE